MARKGGNPNLKGVKGKSGPRKREDILREVKEAIGEKITQEMLIKLANSKVFELLNKCTTIEEVKGLGLPITLKGMTEHKDVKLTLPTPIIQLNAIQPNNSNQQDYSTDEED